MNEIDKLLIARDDESTRKRYRFPDLIVEEAKGAYVFSTKGEEFLDFTSGGQTCNIGHRHPEVMKAISKQLALTGLVSMSWTLNETRIRLAEILRDIVPCRGESRVGFCNTGSDATELTMRLAMKSTGKSSVICHFGCYHGHQSLGSLALNSCSQERVLAVAKVPGVFFVPYPYCYRCLFKQEYPDCDFECLSFIEYQLDTGVIPDDIGAFFFEPVQVHGGVIPLPDGYLRRLSEILQPRGILLVSDEVTTGFGRTGKMFGVEHWDVLVDVVYLAKSLASGLSLGAIVADVSIMDFFKGGGTFSGNPVSCAASIATINTIYNKNLLERSISLGDYFRRRIKELDTSEYSIGDVRGLGLLTGIEIVKADKQPAKGVALEAISHAAKRGLLILPAGVYQNVLRICPPLISTKEQLDLSVEVLKEVLSLVR